MRDRDPRIRQLISRTMLEKRPKVGWPMNVEIVNMDHDCLYDCLAVGQK